MGELVTSILTDVNMREASSVEKALLEKAPDAVPWL